MPSPELVEQLRSEAPHGIRDMGATRERYMIHAAYRAGADQALEVCRERLQGLIELGNLVNDLRLHGLGYSSGTIRAALERLKELEEKANG